MNQRRNVEVAVFAVLWATILMAGCVSGNQETGTGPLVEAQFDEERGAIAGVVTDESLAPVVGATLTLLDASVPAVVSDASGRFGFSLVDPGTYPLSASAMGFGPVVTQVTVIAGETSAVDLRLVSIASDDSYHVTSIVDGYLGCSVAVYVQPADRWQPANVCGIPGLEDEYLVSVPVAGLDVSKLKAIVFETKWESTQVSGSGLNIRISVESDAGTDTFGSPFYDVRGQSPLRMEWNHTLIGELGAAEPSFFAACSPNGACHFELAAYPWPNTLGPGSPADAGVNLEQQFTHYVTEFYGEEAEDSFTAIPDA